MREQSAMNQYFAALVVNLFTIGFGIFEGWTSPTIIPLTSDNSPLPSVKITMDEASWVTALLSVGALTGNILFRHITNYFGRKWLLIGMAVPMIISWTLIWFAQNVYYLYVARVLGGFIGGSGYMIIPLLLGEIANDRVRGTLISSLILAENFGFLLAYIIGNYFDYNAIPQFSIALTVIFAISLYFFPESLIILLKKNKFIEMEKSIKFYEKLSESDRDRKLLELEIDKLMSSLQSLKTATESSSKMNWSDLTTGIALKSMIIGFVLIFLNVYNGSSIGGYVAIIFADTGSNMSPNMSAIVVGAIQVFGSFVAIQLIDRFGRKFLLTTSSIGTALGLIILGVYMMLKSFGTIVDALNWIPLVCLSSVFFVSTLGIQPLTLTVASEVLPEKIKDTCMSFCMTLFWFFTFHNAKYLPFVIEVLGFYGCMYICAGVCISCAIFIFLFIPETRGKSHAEIIRSLE